MTMPPGFAGPKCFDCLAPVASIDEVLCESCKALYAREKERRRAQRIS